MPADDLTGPLDNTAESSHRNRVGCAIFPRLEPPAARRLIPFDRQNDLSRAVAGRWRVLGRHRAGRDGQAFECGCEAYGPQGVVPQGACSSSPWR